MDIDKIISRGESVSQVYFVEVRHCGEYKKVGDEVFTNKWKKISFSKATIGVPNKVFDYRLSDSGFMTYEAANALRWWFHAEHGTGFDSRLVKVKYEIKHTAERVGEYGLIQCELREDIMPDWGNK